MPIYAGCKILALNYALPTVSSRNCWTCCIFLFGSTLLKLSGAHEMEKVTQNYKERKHTGDSIRKKKKTFSFELQKLLCLFP